MIIGTAGHIDHGKTSLVRALTGVDTDRLKEEKARGITIDLGYAYRPLANGDVLGFIDVPGHERFVHNMLAGATGVDFVLLVVAADDGPMPQTREHLQILDLLGLKRGAVALTKRDLVDASRLSEATAEVQALLSGTVLAGSPIFPVSTVGGEDLAALRTHLESQAAALPPINVSGHFRLAVDRCFSLSGTGTVVTGTAFSGAVRPGDRLLISPPGIEVRVRGIHAQNRPAEFGQAGQRCALNLAGQFERSDIQRGDWVVDAPLHSSVQRLDARMQVLAHESKPLRHWTPVHIHLGAAGVTGRVATLEGEAIEPGHSALVQLVLDRPISALWGDRFVIRDQSASRTVGGGVVLDPFPPVRGRRAPARISMLQASRESDHALALTRALEQAPSGIDLARFALSRNLGDEVQAVWRAAAAKVIGVPPAQLGFSAARWEALKHAALDALAEEHRRAPDMPGVERERLRRMAVPALPSAAFAVLADELLQAEALARNGSWLHLPGHRITLGQAEEKLWQRISPLLRETPYQPPRVRDIARALGMDEDPVRQLLRRVARLGEVYPVAHDHYFDREAVVELAAMVKSAALESGAARAAEVRDRIGTGRKLAIQILEFFDRVGYTRRVRDDHLLRRDDFL